MIEYDILESPIGPILIAVRAGLLCSLDFLDFEARFDHLLRIRFPGETLERTPRQPEISQRLDRYFQKDFAAFDGLEVETAGTAFQQQVWRLLREIPPGQTWTYGRLAQQLGNPKGSRAVGHANSLNPIGIVLPCHRVIGSNGSLTGYAGGLERKRWLLEHEGCSFRGGGPNGKVPDLQTVLPFDGR